MKGKLLVAAFSIVLLSWPRTAAAVDCSTFGGRATTVQANVLGIVPVVLSDTGNLDSTGGAKQASLLNASVAGLLSGEDLHATAIGGGSNPENESASARTKIIFGRVGIDRKESIRLEAPWTSRNALRSRKDLGRWPALNF